MRIVDYATFVQLPDGTIFSYYEPVIATGLYRRGSVIRNNDDAIIDYFETNLIAQPPCGFTADYPDLSVGDGSGRLALYDYTQQYAVYEPSDIQRLIYLLTAPSDQE